MAALYADEDVPLPLVERLRHLGHDVVTVTQRGRAGHADAQVLADAVAEGRIVLTHNRKDFDKLHRASSGHFGIVSATRDDAALDALASQIDAALAAHPALVGKHVRVNKPPRVEGAEGG